ncbi:MAG: hypothetical protein ACRCZQ_09300, partial [Bacteroidales bacterium]
MGRYPSIAKFYEVNYTRCTKQTRQMSDFTGSADKIGWWGLILRIQFSKPIHEEFNITNTSKLRP